MSDFMYEFEDNVWDEFGAGATDDHIVPRTVDEYGDQFKVQGDGQTKPQHEVTGVSSIADKTTKYGIFGEKEKCFISLTKNRMLERGLWSQNPDAIFPTSGDNDPLKEVTSMCSDDPMLFNHGLKTGNIDSVSSDFCAGDPVLVSNCATEDNNIYRFPLNHISEANNDLRYFSNNHEEKENGDLLCYGWGDIGNFEDVDMMFRNCDSTFGLGSISNEDDMCWVSSSHATEASQDLLKADAKLNSLPEHCATYRPKNAGPSTINSYNRSVLSDQISSLDMGGDKSGLADMSCLNVSYKESESKDDLTPNEQTTPQKKQSKQLNLVENQIAFYDPLTVQKQVRQSEQDEGHSEVEGFSVGKQPELDSSNVQESYCEATSFRQLQQVTEKLDIRTKLCIRDSLYRLARSAEQRHNCTDMKSDNRDYKDASGPLVAEETNKCTRFMGIETDTNPIDRSIAHLLFHRPSDPSLRPATDTASLMSHGMIHGSSTVPLVTGSHEATGAGSDKKMLS